MAAAAAVVGVLSVAAQAPSARKPVLPPEMDPPAGVVPTTLFSLPEDLEVTIWAEAPLVRNPTNIDIDAQGRVWVTEGVNYRRHAGRGTGGDRVVVLADTDGDGRADRATPFVQEPGLIAPMGMAVIDNQIVVSNTPDLIVYTDVDRDGVFNPRVDRRDVLLTGFLGYNHDHSLHSVTFGPDGKWYFNHGNCGALVTDRSGRTFRIGSSYNGAEPTYGWKAAELAGATSDDGHVYVGGLAFRMNPDGTQLEVIGHNFRNSYEQSVTSFGDVFHNDNDEPPACRTSFLMEYGNLGFASRDGKRGWRADRRPGQSTALAEWRQHDPGVIPAGDVYGNGSPTGIVTYEGDALGEKWRGVLLTCEPARNTVFGYFPRAVGAGYTLERFDFFSSNLDRQFTGIDSMRGQSISGELKTWFRPSDIAVGPDGAIYVADWFDPRVGGHQDLDRTATGAIYRIAPKATRLNTPPFDPSTTAGQILALKSPAINVRATGFLRLRAQGAAAVAPVAALLGDANPYVRARAVFLLAQLGPAGVTRVEKELPHRDPSMRIAAYRALRRAGQPFLRAAQTLVEDRSAAVRREVALSLRDVPLAAARPLLLKLAAGYDGIDRAYLEAWGIGCAGKEQEIYASLARTAPSEDAARWPTSYANLIWRLTPRGSERAWAERAAATSLPGADRLAAVTALGFIDTPAAGQRLLDLAQHSDGPVRDHALWWLINYKDSRWLDQDIDLQLKARGIYDPGNVVLTASTVPEPPPSTLPPAADIAALPSNPARGRDLARACLLCHRIGEEGVDYGPALSGFAKNTPTAVVINAIVHPSSDIAHGFEGMTFTLKDGLVIQGLSLRTGNPVVVQSTGGLTQIIPAQRIKERAPLGRSLMLSAEQLGLSGQDVADIVAYLKTQ